MHSNNGLCLRAVVQYMLLFLVLVVIKFRPVSNFTELHAFTLAARSYALLLVNISPSPHGRLVFVVRTFTTIESCLFQDCQL